MRKVTEYELLRKAQYLSQHLTELSNELPLDDPERLDSQIKFLSKSIPAMLVFAANEIGNGYSELIQQVKTDIEGLAKLLLLTQGYLEFII